MYRFIKLRRLISSTSHQQSTTSHLFTYHTQFILFFINLCRVVNTLNFNFLWSFQNLKSEHDHFFQAGNVNLKVRKACWKFCLITNLMTIPREYCKYFIFSLKQCNLQTLLWSLLFYCKFFRENNLCQLEEVTFLQKVEIGLQSTVWKNRTFTVTQKNFRQINSLVFSLVKTLLSRNFCQKCVRVNFCNFHTVHWSTIQFIIITPILKNFRETKLQYIILWYFTEVLQNIVGGKFANYHCFSVT